MEALEMTRDLRMPISPVALPKDYSIVAINEDNGYLWEDVMEASWGNHQPGAFRYCMVANNGYEEDRVFVLLNESRQPVATSSPWYYGKGHWYEDEYPEVAFVGVIPSYQGNGFGKLMVNHSLQELKKRGYSMAHLGIRGTDTGENYPAVKAYLNCGFTPYIVEEAHVAAWETVCRHLSLPMPILRYEEAAYPKTDMPHPPRPWPYQIRCAAEAQKNDDTYIFGLWHMHNMYCVDADRYILLKPLLMQSDQSEDLISCILAGHVKHIFIDRPWNPESLFFIRDDGSYILIGRSSDERFTNGIEQYIMEQRIN